MSRLKGSETPNKDRLDHLAVAHRLPEFLNLVGGSEIGLRESYAHASRAKHRSVHAAIGAARS
ncbi:MAG TPA: hypothetical protein VJS64_11380, partial [Pyrinomonadaceae bacterium]|nr:hypothetical protein [Pyrinomonadaceae bacterium]